MWTAVNHLRLGILAGVVGRHDADTFTPLSQQVRAWQSYFYVTNGWKVYLSFIDAGDHIVSKTYMARVEAENTRLRHYLARLHRRTLCYSKSVEMLKYSLRLLLYYLRFRSLSVRIGRTFEFEPENAANPYKSPVLGNKMFIITARGSSSYGSGERYEKLNYQEPYLRTIFGFIGITDITFIHVENNELGGTSLAESIAAAHIQVAQLVGM